MPIVMLNALWLLVGCVEYPYKTIDSGDSATTDTAAATTSVPDTDVDPLCDVAPAVYIGTGEEFFEPLSEGDQVPIIAGPQGGWHIWQSIETYNMGEVADTHLSITLASTGAVVSEGKYLVGLLKDEELVCRNYFFGMFGFLDTDDLAYESCDTPPELLGYREVCLNVEVVDEFGVEASDSRCVLAVPWSGDNTRIDDECLPSDALLR